MRARELFQIWIAAMLSWGCTANAPDVHPIEQLRPKVEKAQAKASSEVKTTPTTLEKKTTVTQAVPDDSSTHIKQQPAHIPPVTADACADCHPDKVDGFRETGMGRSLYKPSHDHRRFPARQSNRRASDYKETPSMMTAMVKRV